MVFPGFAYSKMGIHIFSYFGISVGNIQGFRSRIGILGGGFPILWELSMIYCNCFLVFLTRVVFSAALDGFRDSSIFPARLELFRTEPAVLERCVPAGRARCGTIPAAPHARMPSTIIVPEAVTGA